MAGNLTTYAANALLAGSTMPTTLYAAGALGNPGSDGTANPSATAARVVVTLNAPSGGAATASVGTMPGTAAASEDWTHLVLYDAASGGNAWWVVPITAGPVAITAGHGIRIPADALSLSFDLWS